jgi:Fe-S-cluster-containing dehydrogenase component
MNKKRGKGLICDSCYHRLDCNDIPYQVDFCVLYKKETEIEVVKDQKANIQDTIEFNNGDLKLLYKKTR